ncbi:hypothetical protein [Chitinimonas koreensis]|uniref:hypothetical protein n=1 Tax=Chitinimonas koreensis TaxID=356302 RepID=UPI0012F89DB3|nr:hypothetical protein [Chitinimonas koreensis]
MLGRDIVDQVDEVLKKLFTEGKAWLKGFEAGDPRKSQYSSNRPNRDSKAPDVKDIVTEIQCVTNYIKNRASSSTEAKHMYVIVKPDAPCHDDNVVTLIRPVLKINKNHEPCLNFHVWFHHLATNGSEHYMAGWRLEGPEGDETSHDYYHAQPLKKFGEAASTHGAPGRQSERFPTIPLQANNIVELCLTTVLMVGGKEALRRLICTSTNKALRNSAREYWKRVFSGPFPNLTEEK